MNKHLFLLTLAGSLWLTAATPAVASPAVKAPTMVQGYRHITAVENVSVQVPVGNAPRLPFQVWVSYSDGQGEYRQVRWQNSSLVREQAEADPSMNPVGTQYKVKGFIIGDNTTASGYPLTAQVTVVEQSWTVPQPMPVAETLPLDKVSIDGDNRLTWNRNLDIDQLLSLDVKQQLYNYRDTYDLSTDGYPVADGWDSPTTKLKGHGSGHYMSAMAMAFASCQDEGKKARLRSNIRMMVDELRRCQERTFVWDDKLGRYWEARDFAPEEELRQLQGTWQDFDRYKKDYRKYGYGYLNAIPAQHCALIEMYRAYNNERWVWAPYYSVHKQLAGLIDIATYIDDKEVADKALLIARDMGLWVWNRLHYRTFVKSDGNQEERRARPGNRYEMWNMYIAGEVGGMAESLARLSEMVDDQQQKDRLLEAATYFDSPAFFDPLSKNIDAIRTRHANQHIPMVTGALRTYRGNGKPYYYNLAQNFWMMIQGRYRYAMGGVGNGEMFRQPYSQITSMCNNVTSWGGRELHPEPTINETCCAYNLAKLTKDLNCFNPDDAAYMDYYERLLYNQIIGSVNPSEYKVLYQYAVGLNASKPWGNETPQATCCGGTGVENHVKYQEAAYFVSDNTLWVALYMPTTAQWDSKGVTVRQTCQWPAERSIISVKPQQGKKNAKFAMKLRVPYWATDRFDVLLNGKSIAKSYQPCSYVEIPERKWKDKDVVEVVMPFTKHLDFGPDKMEHAPAYEKNGKTDYTPMWAGAFMYGPLVMATTDIRNWDEATINVTADLSEVTLNGASTTDSGADAHLYTMTYKDKTFIPDYQADRHVTHYFRMNIPVDPTAPAVIQTSEGIDKSALRELLLVAKSRHDEQQAWNNLAVKVPEYAPWAPHAFARMESLLDSSRLMLEAPDDKYSQEEIDKATSALNGIINSMRPGNLPELEDMDELMTLLEQARQLPEGNQQLEEAIRYAGMVIRYVSDGSGTMDMIQRATKQLKTFVK
ncbi:MAG: glycoside hydrolase family 127 protein [Prevotella sp.]|nr:glycoside hydrolase family 127 protein [Prevotella sp.]